MEITKITGELNEEELRQVNIADEVIRLYGQRRPVNDIIITIQNKYNINITHKDIFNILKEYQKDIEIFITENPNYFDDKVKRILGRLQDYNIIEFTLWDEYYNVISIDGYDSDSAIRVLDTIRKVLSDKNKVEQLVSSNVEVVHKIRLAEEAQSGFLNIVKDVVTQCPSGYCGKEIQRRLSGRSIIMRELPG